MTYVFVIGLIALTIKFIWDLCKQWVKYAWKQRWRWAKLFRAWCKLLWRGIRKILAGALLLVAVGFIAVAFWFFWSDITILYKKLADLIKDLPKLSNTSDVEPIEPIEQITSTGIIFSISIRYFGIVAAAGAIIGYTIAIARNLISDNQNKISEQGRIAEQISRAIDQIGAYKQDSGSKDNEPNIEARVGGIYSLERIAKDSDDDYEKIMYILCAYVRVTALEKYKTIREDIQAAIDVLGTKKKPLLFWNRDKFRVNLENCDLSNARFSDLNFNTYTSSSSGAIFDDSLFNNVQFHRADLSYVSFDGADLTGADFEEAIFKDTRVAGVDLRKAKNLTAEQVNKMIGNEDTKVPKGMTLSKIEKIPKLKKT